MGQRPGTGVYARPLLLFPVGFAFVEGLWYNQSIPHG